MLSILLAAVLAVSLVPATAFAAEVVDKGYCGEGSLGEDAKNLMWRLYDNGELDISGTGKMKNCSGKFGGPNAPWYNDEAKKESKIIKEATI